MRPIVAIGLVIILGACDPYVAVKGIEAAAKVAGPKESQPPEIEDHFLYDRTTNRCFARQDTKTAAGITLGGSLTEVECTTEVMNQVRLQPKNWKP